MSQVLVKPCNDIVKRYSEAAFFDFMDSTGSYWMRLEDMEKQEREKTGVSIF